MLRDLFPVTSNIVYMNCAAVGPLSVPAAEAMIAHAVDQREYGALHWREWYAEYDRLREAAARLIGADPREIAILKNTSEGLSFVAEGLRWRSGDNVVTTALEFPSNWTPWKHVERRGVEVRVASEPTVGFPQIFAPGASTKPTPWSHVVGKSWSHLRSPSCARRTN